MITRFEMSNLLQQLVSLQNRLPRLRAELQARIETRFEDEAWEASSIQRMELYVSDLSDAIDRILSFEGQSDILLSHVAREPAPDINTILPNATRLKVPQDLSKASTDVFHDPAA